MAAPLIYERANGKIYAREFGSTTRKIVGYDTSQFNDLQNEKYFTLWNDILTMAEHDSELKDLLDRVQVVYNLKKRHE